MGNGANRMPSGRTIKGLVSTVMWYENKLEMAIIKKFT